MEKKKKKPSKTALMKSLREKNKRLQQICERRGDRIDEYHDELMALRRIIPKKFFKIEFKMKANSGSVFTYTEIHEAYTPHYAIEELKKGKTYPNTFELIDIKLLA